MARERKVCSRCHRNLPVAEFWRRRRSDDGLQVWCAECFREWRQQYFADPEKRARHAAAARAWAQTPRGVALRRAAERRRWEAHAEAERERRRRWQAAHPEARREQRRRWQAAHPEARAWAQRIRRRGQRYSAAAQDMAGWL